LLYHLPTLLVPTGNAKLARQAQSKEKQIEKMKQEGLTEKPKKEAGISFKFAEVDINLPQPVLSFQNVTFGYTRDKILLRNVRTRCSCRD
jgi:ATP-binding cassette subfamily F protein 2